MQITFFGHNGIQHVHHLSASEAAPTTSAPLMVAAIFITLVIAVVAWRRLNRPVEALQLQEQEEEEV